MIQIKNLIYHPKALVLIVINKWGHLNFSKETTSKNTIEEGSSVLQSQNMIKKSMEEDKNCKMVVYTSNNKSPISGTDYDTPNVEK